MEFFKRLLVVGGVFAVLGLATLFIVDRGVMRAVVKSGCEVRVPDVVEFDTSQARAILEDSGFKLVVDGEENDQNVPAGAILSQNPTAFSVTKEGRRIHVVLSHGPTLEKMPDVTGQSLRQALIVLREKHLEKGTVRRVYLSKIPNNVVVKQSIPVDSLVLQGTLVDLTVSTK